MEAQDGNIHKIRAYRNAANRILSTERSISEIVSNNNSAKLQEIPGIGEGIARIISRFVETGRSDLLDRLQGEISPEKVFSQVPGIGEKVGTRIAEDLDIETLQQLEQAAYNGRLAEIDGFGPKLVQNVRISLAGLLSRHAEINLSDRGRKDGEGQVPEVGLLLEIDAEYREKADKGQLKKIAPKRFNPKGDAWLPIMHTSKQEWDFTVLYSNTKRAHDLKKTHDWVVVYYEKDHVDGQATVVTGSFGSLKGKRIVRGREKECEEYYSKNKN